MTNWQPIETAPRDRYILLLFPEQPDWAGNMEVGKWFGEKDGCFWSVGGPNGGLELDRDFTHWMELPPSTIRLADVQPTCPNCHASNGHKEWCTERNESPELAAMRKENIMLKWRLEMQILRAKALRDR